MPRDVLAGKIEDENHRIDDLPVPSFLGLVVESPSKSCPDILACFFSRAVSVVSLVLDVLPSISSSVSESDVSEPDMLSSNSGKKFLVATNDWVLFRDSTDLRLAFRTPFRSRVASPSSSASNCSYGDLILRGSSALEDL